MPADRSLCASGQVKVNVQESFVNIAEHFPDQVVLISITSLLLLLVSCTEERAIEKFIAFQKSRSTTEQGSNHRNHGSKDDGSDVDVSKIRVLPEPTFVGNRKERNSDFHVNLQPKRDNQLPT